MPALMRIDPKTIEDMDRSLWRLLFHNAGLDLPESTTKPRKKQAKPATSPTHTEAEGE